MKARLTCCKCYRTSMIDADRMFGDDDLETWWLLRRRQHCAECWKHTCWMDLPGDNVCGLDIGHDGDHLPWDDAYGDASWDPADGDPHVMVPGLATLWDNWEPGRAVHHVAP